MIFQRNPFQKFIPDTIKIPRSFPDKALISSGYSGVFVLFLGITFDYFMIYNLPVLLTALTSACTEASMISSFIPAPHTTFPSSVSTPT